MFPLLHATRQYVVQINMLSVGTELVVEFVHELCDGASTSYGVCGAMEERATWRVPFLHGQSPHGYTHHIVKTRCAVNCVTIPCPGWDATRPRYDPCSGGLSHHELSYLFKYEPHFLDDFLRRQAESHLRRRHNADELFVCPAPDCRYLALRNDDVEEVQSCTTCLSDNYAKAVWLQGRFFHNRLWVCPLCDQEACRLCGRVWSALEYSHVDLSCEEYRSAGSRLIETSPK